MTKVTNAKKEGVCTEMKPNFGPVHGYEICSKKDGINGHSCLFSPSSSYCHCAVSIIAHLSLVLSLTVISDAAGTGNFHSFHTAWPHWIHPIPQWPCRLVIPLLFRIPVLMWKSKRSINSNSNMMMIMNGKIYYSAPVIHRNKNKNYQKTTISMNSLKNHHRHLNNKDFSVDHDLCPLGRQRHTQTQNNSDCSHEIIHPIHTNCYSHLLHLMISEWYLLPPLHPTLHHFQIKPIIPLQPAQHPVGWCSSGALVDSNSATWRGPICKSYSWPHPSNPRPSTPRDSFLRPFFASFSIGP